MVEEIDYHDPEWVAERLGIDKNTVYKFLQDGTIPAVQLGRKWLISERRLSAWLGEEADRQTRARSSAASSADRTIRRMDNFTPEARMAIRAAHSEARRYNHDYLGQEHLLLGFAANAESTAGKLLSAAGVDMERIRNAVESRVAAGTSIPPRRLGRDAHAKDAMRLAMKEAQARGDGSVASDHLLVGIMQSGEGLGFELLREFGLTEDRIRASMQTGETTHA